MTAQELIKRIEQIFEQKLQAKTGWGRNDIMKVYQEAQIEALLEATQNVIKN